MRRNRRQFTLFGGAPISGPPPHSEVDTSIEAAERISWCLNELQMRVFYIVATSNDGLTTKEVVELLDMNPNTANPRMWELEGSGGHYPALLRKSERKRAGARVRVLTDRGVLAARYFWPDAHLHRAG
jgi:hypothetical protein